MKKNSLLKFVFWVFALLLILCATLELTSCQSRHGYAELYEESTDSIVQAAQLKDYFNPTFTSVDSVLKYKRQIEKSNIDDSIIRHMPTETLINVSTVLINKSGSFTKSDLVDEYLKSISIYNNLPTNLTNNGELQRDTSQYISYKDTTINGNKTKVITKTILINKK